MPLPRGLAVLGERYRCDRNVPSLSALARKRETSRAAWARVGCDVHSYARWSKVMSRAKPALYAGHCSIYWTYKTPVSGLQPGLPVEKLGKNPIKNLPCNPAPHHCSPLACWTRCASAYGTCTIASAQNRFTFTGCVFSYAGLGAVGKCSTRAGTVQNLPEPLGGQYSPYVETVPSPSPLKFTINTGCNQR